MCDSSERPAQLIAGLARFAIADGAARTTTVGGLVLFFPATVGLYDRWSNFSEHVIVLSALGVFVFSYPDGNDGARALTRFRLPDGSRDWAQGTPLGVNWVGATELPRFALCV